MKSNFSQTIKSITSIIPTEFCLMGRVTRRRLNFFASRSCLHYLRYGRADMPTTNSYKIVMTLKAREKYTGLTVEKLIKQTAFSVEKNRDSL